MEHDRLQNLVPLAAANRLEPEEREALDAHLAAGCTSCESELRELRDAIVAMAQGAAQDDPVERTWRMLQNRLTESRREAETSQQERNHTPTISAISTSRWRSGAW